MPKFSVKFVVVDTTDFGVVEADNKKQAEEKVRDFFCSDIAKTETVAKYVTERVV